MPDSQNPDDMDEVVTLRLPRGQALMLRRFIENLQAAETLVRWGALVIGGVAVVMGIIYSFVSVFGAKFFGQGGQPPHGG